MLLNYLSLVTVSFILKQYKEKKTNKTFKMKDSPSKEQQQVTDSKKDFTLGLRMKKKLVTSTTRQNSKVSK